MQKTLQKKWFISGISTLALIVVSVSACGNSDEKQADETAIIADYEVTIPAGSNSWVVNDIEEDQTIITGDGIHNWSNTSTLIRSYFKLSSKGSLQIGLDIKASTATSVIRFTLNGQSQEVTVSNTTYQTIDLNEFTIPESGYYALEMQGVRKEGALIADITNIHLGGEAAKGTVTFVPKENTYFGRRGPSVHWAYEAPQNEDVKWFYNEIKVPTGSDVVGSYFMANGFGEGYFGIQVNSATERRVLFSLWSPFQTDDPSSIPEEDRIQLIRQGEDVVVGEFGNEGSGGQSFLRYDWKAGNTYQFLLKGEPTNDGSTAYTAYFYAPEEGNWKLIAGFERPKTVTYLTNMYSFLENFVPSTGHIERSVAFGNQWVYTTNNDWIEMTKAKHTADATARGGHRADYNGSVNENVFELKNCGFFDETSVIDVTLERSANTIPPNIDFEVIENL